MGRTKVAGIAGRFRARYGSTLRARWKDVMIRRYQEYNCPFCGFRTRMKRVSVGIWHCPKCGKTYAGAAYQPLSS